MGNCKSSVQMQLVVATTDEKQSCPICLDNVNAMHTVLGCNHAFCTKCIDEWKRRENTCPCCRKLIDDIEDLRLELLARSCILKVMTSKHPHFNGVLWMLFGIYEPDFIKKEFAFDDYIAAITGTKLPNRDAALAKQLQCYDEALDLVVLSHTAPGALSKLIRTTKSMLKQNGGDVMTTILLLTIAGVHQMAHIEYMDTFERLHAILGRNIARIDQEQPCMNDEGMKTLMVQMRSMLPDLVNDDDCSKDSSDDEPFLGKLGIHLKTLPSTLPSTLPNTLPSTLPST
jgi:hypothetical protein